MKGLVTGFKAKTFLNFFLHELYILQEIVVWFYSFSTGHLDDFYTIVAPINTSSNTESTWENAVFDTLSAVFEGGAWLSQFAVDAEGSE